MQFIFQCRQHQVNMPLPIVTKDTVFRNTSGMKVSILNATLMHFDNNDHPANKPKSIGNLGHFKHFFTFPEIKMLVMHTTFLCIISHRCALKKDMRSGSISDTLALFVFRIVNFLSSPVCQDSSATVIYHYISTSNILCKAGGSRICFGTERR